MRDSIDAVLAAQGIHVSEDEATALRAHLDAVLAANKAFNLTRISDYAEGIRLHILDSLLILPEISAAPAGLLVDIGSGAGFPGIPLAIVSRRDTVLVESVKKKASFLENVVQELGLAKTVSVAALRSEEAADSYRAGASVVTARAVAALEVLVELAAPFLAVGGHVVAPKGNLSSGERDAGRRAARICGLEEASFREYDLPGANSEHRTVVVYRRVADPRVVLPRRPGMAKKHPLSA